MSEERAARYAAGAVWCLDFIHRRCGASVSAFLHDENSQDVAGSASQPCVLSLAEVNQGAEADGRDQEYMAVIAMRIGGEPAAERHRVVLRFITAAAMRNAARADGSRSVIADIVIRTPPRLVEVSLLVYRIRRRLHLQRALAAIDNMIETFEAGKDDDNLMLGRAVLERLEAFDGDVDAGPVLGASRIPIETAEVSGKGRLIAVVAGASNAGGAGHFWLRDRVLCQGPIRDSAVPVTGRPFAMLRYGARSTWQSPRAFIDEIRARHQRRAGEPTLGAEGESFSSFVDRELAKRTQKQRQDFINRLGIDPSDRLLVETPIAVEISDDLASLIAGPPTSSLSDAASQGVEALRNRVMARIGIKLPGTRFRGKPELAVGGYTIRLHESLVASGQCRTDRHFLPEHGSETAALGIAAEPGHHPGVGKGFWIAPDNVPKTQIPVWETLDYPLRHLEHVILDNLIEFLGYEETTALLSENAGPSAKAIDSDPALVARFAGLLRRLVREQVPVLTFEPICDSFIGMQKNQTSVLECVARIRMLDGVRNRLPGNEPHRTFVRLGPTMMNAIGGSLKVEEGRAPTLSLEPDVAQEIVSHLRIAIANAPGACTLIAPETPLRTYVWLLMRYEVANVPVLAADELLFDPVEIVQVDLD